MVLGLLGGVGSGKSTVAQLLERWGALVLDADRESRRVMEQADVIAAVRSRFGDRVLAPGGRIDRAALSRQVFGEGRSAERRFLEELVHPRVRDGLRRRLDQARKGSELAVLDVPLLLEGHLVDWCDVLVFVDASEENRVARTARDRGWDVAELRRREGSQASLEAKRSRAHHVVVNNGTLDELKVAVAALVDRLGMGRHDLTPGD